MGAATGLPKHIVIARLIAGAPLLFLGAQHFIDPEPFRKILLASSIPMLDLNMIAAPAAAALAFLNKGSRKGKRPGGCREGHGPRQQPD